MTALKSAFWAVMFFAAVDGGFNDGQFYQQLSSFARSVYQIFF
jgi:hypothetical protein